ncbi:MAG: hypothetical protein QMD12_02390 [Candidatus Aenigmarchaeota archaeon]|nr:hypothetical protein [Candidatus Aenigmarchaeota archaeon]
MYFEEACEELYKRVDLRINEFSKLYPKISNSYSYSKEITKNLIYPRAQKIYSISKRIARDKRAQWFVAGSIIYGLPALYRYITKNPNLPYFPIIEPPSKMIPSNLAEKLIVNSVFPGATSSVVIGETIAKRRKLSGVKKHLSRFSGSFIGTGLWIGFQCLGHYTCEILKYEWPSGGNPFEGPSVYPFNILMGLFATITPYVVDYVKSEIERKLTRFPEKESK